MRVHDSKLVEINRDSLRIKSIRQLWKKTRLPYIAMLPLSTTKDKQYSPYSKLCVILILVLS